ncbi:MAG: transposase [Alteromonas macleodii]
MRSGTGGQFLRPYFRREVPQEVGRAVRPSRNLLRGGTSWIWIVSPDHSIWIHLLRDSSLFDPDAFGDQIKTDRRDAERLARLLRAGELTPIWVPDETHEAMRDLVRARDSAAQDQRYKRQLISAFLLRHGRIYYHTKTWTMRYRRWLQRQSFDHPAKQVALQEMVLAERHAVERVGRLTTGIEELMLSWKLGPVVEALQALRGVALISAVTFMAEIGDFRRFEKPRKLMGYLGLAPS